MADQELCNVENEPFPREDFATGPNGVRIHVINKTSGHTVDGLTAVFKASRTGGDWKLEEISFPDIDAITNVTWQQPDE